MSTIPNIASFMVVATDCVVLFKLSEPLLTKCWLCVSWPLLDIYCQGSFAFCWKFLASMALISVSIWCV